MDLPLLAPDYRPSPAEDYMSPAQLAYFKQKLLDWKRDLLREGAETISNLKQETSALAESLDRATAEMERNLEFRTRDRYRKLIGKIDAAIQRIEEGEYGYCEVTGEAIGLNRLEARPIATLSIEAQEAHERRERAFRDM